MPLKTSKLKPTYLCSEKELPEIAREIAKLLRPNFRVLLNGPMGAGKTTFARELLKVLGVSQPPEGSPSFAIVHEYRSAIADVAHMDFYRLKSEREIEEAGIPSYFWERKMIVISEWLSLWPEMEAQVIQTGNWVQINFEVHSEGMRKLSVSWGEPEE